MSNSKSPAYRIYDFITTKRIKAIRATGVKQKHASDREIIRRWCQSDGATTAPYFYTLMDEWLWDRHGRNVIFPLPDLVDGILGAKFEVTSDKSLDWPFRSCMIATPNIGPLSIFKGMMVTWIPYNQMADEQTVPFIKDMGMNAAVDPSVGHESKDGDYLSVTYQLWFEGKWVHNKINMTVSNLPQILCATNPGDFDAALGGINDETTEPPSEFKQYGTEVGQLLLRFISGLAVLYKLNPKTLLSEGLPGVRFSGSGKPPRGSVGLVASVPADLKNEHRGDSVHHRRWHFRTLSNERFYRGEHADLPVGSRVVFVKDSVVGRAKASTAEATCSF